MVGVADDDDGADAVVAQQWNDVVEVVVCVARGVFKEDVVRGHALFDGVAAADFRFGHEAFFGRAAGKHEFFHAFALIQGDGVIDALLEHRRGAFVPCGRAEHNGGIGAHAGGQGLVAGVVNRPNTAGKRKQHQQQAQHDAVQQVVA